MKQHLGDRFWQWAMNERPDPGPPITVDCTNDPFNIGPAVDLALIEIARVRAKVPRGTPVVVVLGEMHDASAHHAFKIELLRRITALSGENGEAYKTACGLEKPYNLPGIILNRGFDFNLPRATADALTATDPDGKRSLKTALAELVPVWAPTAHATWTNYLLNSPVSVRFNDVAICDNEEGYHFIDKDAPRLKAVISRIPRHERSVNFGMHDGFGMRLRNMTMVDNAMRHIKDTQADIYIQSCGNGHVVGSFGRGDELGVYELLLRVRYKESLCPLFSQAGAYPIPIMMGTRAEPIINGPKDAKAMMARSIIIEGLADDEHPPFDRPMYARGEQRMQHIAAMSDIDRFDVFHPKMTQDKDTRDSARMKEEVRRDAPQWIAEAEASLR